MEPLVASRHQGPIPLCPQDEPRFPSMWEGGMAVPYSMTTALGAGEPIMTDNWEIIPPLVPMYLSPWPGTTHSLPFRLGITIPAG